jgi:hypothetical protein
MLEGGRSGISGWRLSKRLPAHFEALGQADYVPPHPDHNAPVSRAQYALILELIIFTVAMDIIYLH